ncbi:MAG TPA: hypothetical protein VFB79_04115, partial [Candidatus Angelobacter sp.]|nr:hypothetical protein [Candidatus Angelobacter sp.]
YNSYITSDPIQDRMGLWPRKPSPLLGHRPILISAPICNLDVEHNCGKSILKKIAIEILLPGNSERTSPCDRTIAFLSLPQSTYALTEH